MYFFLFSWRFWPVVSWKTDWGRSLPVKSVGEHSHFINWKLSTHTHNKFSFSFPAFRAGLIGTFHLIWAEANFHNTDSFTSNHKSVAYVISMVGVLTLHFSSVVIKKFPQIENRLTWFGQTEQWMKQKMF